MTDPAPFHLHRAEVVGLIAGFGTSLAALPDLITMFRHRSSRGMNPSMAAIMAVFQFVWIYYGYLIDSWPVVAWNVVAIVINSLTVAAYLYFSRQEKRRL